MESCARVMPLVPQYAEGELSTPEASRVASHLECCGPCMVRVRLHRELLSALDRLPQVIPPSSFRATVMSRVLAAAPPARAARPRHLRLVKALFWTSLAGAGGSATGTAVLFLGRDVAGRTALFDPNFFVEWLGSFSRFALSLLLEIATRSEIPGPWLPSHTALISGSFLTALSLAALAAGALGVGFFATLRALLGKSRS
jgi:anti-sigma factor RsiW